MNDFIRLSKINLKSFFTTNKKFYDQKTNKKKNWKILLIIYIFLALGTYIYIFANTSMKGYLALNIPYILLAQFMAISSITLFTTNIYKINGTLFGYKDYDLLMSLPINKKAIILSKIFLLYVSNLIYLLIFMIPSFIVYIKYVNPDIIFYILFWISLFFIPLIPIIISTIVGTLITFISSKFKKNNLVNLVLTIGFIVLIMYFSQSIETKGALDLANIGNSMVNIFNKIYPLTRTYVNIIKENSIISLLIFISIPISLFILFVYGIEKYYKNINSNILKQYTNNKFTLKTYKAKSQIKALYKKEIKRFFSSVNYIINCSLGSIFMIFMCVAIPIIGIDKATEVLNVPELETMLGNLTPILLALFCSLNCTTYASISLEGKSFSILKSLPVNPMTIFISKILVNLTILIPAIIISSIVLTISLKLSIITFVFCLIVPVLYAFFISITGLIYNLLFPNFNWTNELRVIKQSIPSFLSIATGLLFAIIPITINNKLNLSSNIFLILLSGIMIIICLLEYYYLKYYGIKRFNKLN